MMLIPAHPVAFWTALASRGRSLSDFEATSSLRRHQHTDSSAQRTGFPCHHRPVRRCAGGVAIQLGRTCRAVHHYLISSEFRTSALGMRRLCPGVLGKASRIARLCSVSKILVDGMSPSRIFLRTGGGGGGGGRGQGSVRADTGAASARDRRVGEVSETNATRATITHLKMLLSSYEYAGGAIVAPVDLPRAAARSLQGHYEYARPGQRVREYRDAAY